MAAHRKEIAGQRFGRLVAVTDVGKTAAGRRLWLFKCDCGKEKHLPSAEVTGKNGPRSCGCLRKEIMERQQQASRTHCGSKTRLYSIWRSMKKRCYTPSTHEFNNYGGRGITVCEEWLNSFEAFRDWALSNGYADNLTLDRKRSDGNYEPSNCRWATWTEQERNRRNVRMVQYSNETLTLTELSERTGVPYPVLYGRVVRRGWGVEAAISTPVNERRGRNEH